MPKVSPYWQRLNVTGGVVPVEMCWVPVSAQEAQERAARLRTLLIQGVQRVLSREQAGKETGGAGRTRP